MPLPERISDYVIVGKLGEGGMGIVYEAEQQHPKRRVALKVVRGGHFVSEIEIKMFEREAETLARLKHPNIAAIYESGRTDDGQHFFAMELVRGKTLDRYAPDRGAAGVRERLLLARTICEAVNYAHQRGVIHRDLKPSNILVVEEECALKKGDVAAGARRLPQIKILDFGLARITDGDVGASIVSEVGAIKGTLPYMSPEQVRGIPEEIDLRSDVYSLGVILYQLLTGSLPYDTQKASIVEAARVICEEPAKPFRNTGAARRQLESDIETIVFKALEKAPDRRYQSAAALGDDIDRYLTSQPIVARPPSTIYQLRKLVVRHKGAFAFVATILLLLAGFGVWMSVLYTRSEANLVRALSAEATAGLEASTAKQVSEFMVGLFKVSDPSESRGNTITAREILDRGADQIELGLSDQPEVKANLMATMGAVYSNLGLYGDGRDLLEKALQERRALFGEDHLDVAAVELTLATLLDQTGDGAKARNLFESALATRERALGPDHADVMTCVNGLAINLWRAGDLAAAERLYQRALTSRETALGPESPELVSTLNNMGILRRTAGDYDGALVFYNRALAIQEKAGGPDDPKVASILNGSAIVYWKKKDHASARQRYDRALAIREKVFGLEHPLVGQILHNLGELLMTMDDAKAARPLLERALAIHERAFGPEHEETTTTLVSLGEVQRMLGRPADAIDLLKRALAACEKAVGPDHVRVAQALIALADAEAAVGRMSEARRDFDRAIAIEEKALGSNHPEFIEALNRYAELLRENGNLDEASRLAARAQAMSKRSTTEQ